MGDGNDLAERVNALETVLNTEKSTRTLLTERLNAESQERKEALLWQEHRIVAAIRSLYQHRGDNSLRWAALGGLLSAFIGRTATTAALGGGLLALALTAALTLHANYLLIVQNEKMDVQTIVMDAQRRTQNFQAEFTAITEDVRSQLARLQTEKEEADKDLLKELVRLRQELREIAAAIDASKPELGDVIRSELRSAERKTERVPTGQTFVHELESLTGMAAGFGSSQLDASNRLIKAQRAATAAYNSRRAGKWSFDEELGNATFYELDRSVLSRIAGLATSSRPYPTLSITPRIAPDGDQSVLATLQTMLLEGKSRGNALEAGLNDDKVSVERGQLLTYLISQKIALARLADAGADFRFADLSSRLISQTRYQYANLGGANFFNSVLFNVVFSGTLAKTNFRCVTFASVSFVEANLKDADFSHAQFTRTRPTTLTLQHLVDANFANARLGGTRLADTASQMPSPQEFSAGNISVGALLLRAFPDKKNIAELYQHVWIEAPKEGYYAVIDKRAESGSRAQNSGGCTPAAVPKDSRTSR